MVLTRIVGAVTVANSEQMKVVGYFFTSSWTKKLGRIDSLSVSILWESCENFFLQYYSLQVVRKQSIQEDTIHLDSRCKWTAPSEHEGLFSFADPFKCPFANWCHVQRGWRMCTAHPWIQPPEQNAKESPMRVCVVWNFIWLP